MKTALLILGNQLFDPAHIQAIVPADTKLFMREDIELCTYARFHKHKIIFFLAAMRTFAIEMQKNGFVVHYEELSPPSPSFENSLLAWTALEQITRVYIFEIEDKFFEKRIFVALKSTGVEIVVLRTPMFLTSRVDFRKYLAANRTPFMMTFYEWQRRRFKILVDSNDQPQGGSWSFDDQNRLALPRTLETPEVFGTPKDTLQTSEVKALVDQHFATHPGTSESFWLPVDRAGARVWLSKFLSERLATFGPYEDAISPRSDFVFHSVLTPFLNTGLLTPREVVAATLSHAREQDVPLNSLEGFIRQVVGWREFIRGIYQNFSERQELTNFWKHSKKIKACWYDGTTDIPPLDHAIQKAVKFAYAHHIERLMVIGSLMLLLEVEPQEAHRWFMEMFIDSSDWVMGPNVYGMAIFSDGGIFATKPYLCGSNYYRKMGGYKQEEWCDGVDGLYWGFIERHQSFFLKNPRLSMMAKNVDSMDTSKKARLYAAADRLRARLVE